MSDVNTALTANACTEFINTVDQVSSGTFREKPEVAGWVSVVLSLIAEGSTAMTDSGASTTAGP